MYNTKLFDRVFFGFQPGSHEKRDMIAVGGALCAEECIATPLRSDVFHATLAVTLDTDRLTRQIVARYKAAGDLLSSLEFEQFRLTFAHAARSGRRTSPQPLVLTSKEGRQTFRAMQRGLVASLTKLQLPPLPYRPSNPHATLFYGFGSLHRAITPISWHLSELRLIRSHVGLGRHEVLAGWPLLEPLDLFAGVAWNP